MPPFALVMVLLARLAGRPREYLSMLAAAAMVVAILRPADIGDAGFQLSFVSTASTILFAERAYHGLFGRWIERETLVADLANTPWARWRLRAYRWSCGLLVANVIGAVTAGPLVPAHFGQVNVWSVLSGLARRLPVVSVAMAIGALQTAAAVLWGGLADWISPASIIRGRAHDLGGRKTRGIAGFGRRRAPAADLGNRAHVRRDVHVDGAEGFLGISRAMVLNAAVAIAAITVYWYAWTVPIGKLQMTLLCAGQGESCGARSFAIRRCVDHGCRNGRGQATSKVS